MAKHVVLDELHVQLLIPREMPNERLTTVRRLIHGRRFRQQVLRMTRSLIAGIPDLASVRVQLVK